MANLIYSAIASLDGYIADVDGKFDWAEPDDEVHAFINDLDRPIGTYLLGRRMYEVLVYWEDPPALDQQPSYVQEFAQIWQAAEKIVYSRTLETVSTARTRIERHFDPEAIRQLKAQSERNITVGGPDLAAQAIRAGLGLHRSGAECSRRPHANEACLLRSFPQQAGSGCDRPLRGSACRSRERRTIPQYACQSMSNVHTPGRPPR